MENFLAVTILEIFKLDDFRTYESTSWENNSRSNKINLSYHSKNANYKGLCFHRRGGRVLFRYPSQFEGNAEFIQRLVNLIQRNNNRLLSQRRQEPLTNYSMLNEYGDVVLVDKQTFINHNRK